jgi:hypothetical protein
MGFVQNTRQRLGSAAHFVGRHAATAGKAALTAAAVAGAAYSAYQTHGQVQAQRGGYPAPRAHGGGRVGGFLGSIPGTASLELLREAQAERRMGVRFAAI